MTTSAMGSAPAAVLCKSLVLILVVCCMSTMTSAGSSDSRRRSKAPQAKIGVSITRADQKITSCNYEEIPTKCAYHYSHKFS